MPTDIIKRDDILSWFQRDKFASGIWEGFRCIFMMSYHALSFRITLIKLSLSEFIVSKLLVPSTSKVFMN